MALLVSAKSDGAILEDESMRILMLLSLAVLLVACQSATRGDRSAATCGPGGMGCSQGPMPYGDIDGAVGGSSPD